MMGIALWLFLPASLLGAEIQGTVAFQPRPLPERPLGFTRTQVLEMSEWLSGLRTDYALFLKAVESPTIPTPKEHARVEIRGLELRPAIASCAVDGQVEFQNAERVALNLQIEGVSVGPIEPGQKIQYECTAGAKSIRTVRIAEWPHARGSVFVGEVGVAAQADGEGHFLINAPPGQYELQVVGEDGFLLKKSIEVGTVALELGTLGVTSAVETPSLPSPPVESPSVAKLAEKPATNAKPAATAKPTARVTKAPKKSAKPAIDSTSEGAETQAPSEAPAPSSDSEKLDEKRDDSGEGTVE